jgi:sulfur carrier protein
MKVVLNGETTDIQPGATVQALLDGLDLPADGRGVAVAVDQEVVPRGEWARHELNDGAKVEILRAIQGG